MNQVAAPKVLEHRYLWIYVVPLVFVILWSSGFTFAKMGLAHAGPFTLLALRYILVILVLAPLYVMLRPPLPRRTVDWLHQMVVGFLIQVVFFGCVYTAVTNGVSASGMGLIFSLQPVLVGLLAPTLTGETVNSKCWLGLILGLLGTGLVILGRSSVEVTSIFGYTIAMCAVLGMTSATLYEKRFGTALHPITSNMVQCGVGLAVTLPMGYLSEHLQVDWSTGLYVSLGYLVLCNSLVSITLLLAMIRRGEAARVSALFFLVPPTAAIVAWALIGERIPSLAWFGMIVAAIGVAVVTKSSNKPFPAKKN